MVNAARPSTVNPPADPPAHPHCSSIAQSPRTRKTKSQEQNANVLEITEFCRSRGFDAELVGKWVWVSFEEAPDEETRQALKEAGFIYSPRRQKWAHNCGHPSPSAYQSDPWHKYAARWVSGRYFREATA